MRFFSCKHLRLDWILNQVGMMVSDPNVSHHSWDQMHMRLRVLRGRGNGHCHCVEIYRVTGEVCRNIAKARVRWRGRCPG